MGKIGENFGVKLDEIQSKKQVIDESKDVAREMGSPRQASNRRRRTREGPEPVCVR